MARIPFAWPSSPRYAPHGQLMIATSTGFPRGETPSSPKPGERDRAEVALGEAVRGDELDRRGAQLLDRVREPQAEQPGGVVQAAQVVGEPEDRRARRGLVGADALEDARAVVEAVRGDVHRSRPPTARAGR